MEILVIVAVLAVALIGFILSAHRNNNVSRLRPTDSESRDEATTLSAPSSESAGAREIAPPPQV